MRDLADWSDPDFELEQLPQTVPVAYVESCPNCGGDFGAHCFDCTCPMWLVVGCHRVHRVNWCWGPGVFAPGFGYRN
jgi:hypothetical protein